MIRYYPSTKIKTNQKALPGEFILNGVVYSGYYYSTYDGKFFSGANPIVGNNEELQPTAQLSEKNKGVINSEYEGYARMNEARNRKTQPISYNPLPTESDYSRGYLLRYFVKRTNQSGYVMEISETEYGDIKNGTAPYDISFYKVIEIAWKLTGPLKNKRISQYDTRAGITETNKRLVETADRNFRGVKEYIGEDYTKFARPTEQ